MSVENMLRQGNAVVQSPGACIQMDYLSADCVLPITVRRGKITEAAFCAPCTLHGDACIYLQVHRLRADGTYRIENRFFKSTETGGIDSYEQVAVPEGVLAAVDTGCTLPWFSVFSPAVENNLDGGPGLGMSVFAEALDQIEGADRAYNNFVKDIYLGGKKVFYSQSLLQSSISKDGTAVVQTPDDVQQQLFVQPAESVLLGEQSHDIYEYNPSLRVEENTKAVQSALDYLSFKCGFGTHHYRFESGSIATATQYNGDRQDMVQSANRHQTPIEAALCQIVRAMLWAGKNILGAPVDPETSLSVNWDDSYISDSETRRAQMKDDVRDGIYPAWRYLTEWYGMSEEEAKAAVAEAGKDAQPGISFGGDA